MIVGWAEIDVDGGTAFADAIESKAILLCPEGDICGCGLNTNALPLDGLFTPIADCGFSGAQIPITSARRRQVGLSVYGFNAFHSYGYPGGMALGKGNEQKSWIPCRYSLSLCGGLSPFGGLSPPPWGGLSPL